MNSILVTFLALVAGQTTASPAGSAPKAQPTLYLAGDSTMALKGANNGRTDGWGNYINSYVRIPVVNKALSGRSARSYTNEGHFHDILDVVKPGDIVVIEFGHNDVGSPTGSSENGRSDCPGNGSSTCISGKDGSTVYTFDHYITAAAKSYTAKGASVIVSSQTPNNIWEGGVLNDTPSRFVAYAQLAAKDAGANTYYVDHFAAAAALYRRLGSAATNALYPTDHTHTSPSGANLTANAFAEAVQKANNPLTALVKAGIPQAY